MSAYSSSFSITSRGAGQSAVAHGAYIMRARLLDEREGLVKDYRKGHAALVTSGILTPDDAPGWTQDVGSLLNTIEAAEKRKDAQLTRNLILALPHELTPERRDELVQEALGFWVERGAIALYAIHHPDPNGDDRNHHAHVMLTMRELDGDRFAAKKNRDWNADELADAWRDHWAERGAAYLRQDGFELEATRYRHGHLDLATQRELAAGRGDFDFADSLNRQAGKKLGVVATNMERRGVATDRGDLNRARRSVAIIDLAAERAARQSAAEAVAEPPSGIEQPTQPAAWQPTGDPVSGAREAAEATPPPNTLEPPKAAAIELAAVRGPEPAGAAEPPKPRLFGGLQMALANVMHRAQHELESFIGFVGDFFIGNPHDRNAGLGSSEPTYQPLPEPEQPKQPERAPEPDMTQERAAGAEKHLVAERGQEQAHAEREAASAAHAQQQKQSELEWAQELHRQQQRHFAEINRDNDRDR